MKKTILLLILIAIGMVAQAQETYIQDTTIHYQDIPGGVIQIGDRFIMPSKTIQFNFEKDSLEFILSISSKDSVRVSGNMTMAEAAKKFFDILNEWAATQNAVLNHKIDSLKNVIIKLKAK